MKFLTQAAKALQEKKRYQHRLAIFLCLAIVVTLGTFAALKLRGQAMTHQRKVLKCQVEIHQHSEECYDKEEKGKLICGQADYVAHKHNDDCYNLDSGELVCHIKELEVHKHDDSCYQEEKVLVCKEEEKDAHTHTPECYIREKGDLQCVLEEHAHAQACYIRENTGLQCGFEEHTHADGCYDETGALTCQQEEHQHSDDCYAWTETLNCPLEEHQHNDDCYTWTETLACQQEEVQDGHMHTDECYETKKTLVCEKEEVELHTHDENCQDENGALICNKLQVEEHIHGAECFETVELNDEEVAALNTPEPEEEEPAGDNSASSSSANEDSASKNSTSKNSASGNSTSDNSSASGNSASDNETGHVHDESCYDSAGGLMCGFEGETPDITKVCENENYIVTAGYNKDANIPEEAELRVEMITADKDEDHYANREAEIREALNDENVKIDALFKIGFYVDGEEIEPESDVNVTIQFLDENGLEDGTPMTIIHFGEDGNEVLSGSHAKDRSTTFKTNKFSDFAALFRNVLMAARTDVLSGADAEPTDEEEKPVVSADNTNSENSADNADPAGSADDTSSTNKAEFAVIKGYQLDGAQTVEETALPKSVSVSGDYAYKGNGYDVTFHVEGKAAVSENISSENTVPGEGTADGEETIENGGAGDDEEAAGNGGAIEGEESAGEENLGVDPEEDAEQNGSAGEGGAEESAEGPAAGGETGDDPSEGGSADEERGTVVIDDAENEKLKFKIQDLGSNSAEHSAVSEYVREKDNGSQSMILEVLSYAMEYEGAELDLSECKVTAVIRPEENVLKEYAEKLEDGNSASKAVEKKITVKVINVAEDGSVDELRQTVLGSKDTDNGIEEVELQSYDMAVTMSAASDPKFTVQYYANLKVVKKGGTAPSNADSLDVINTHTDNGAKLPENRYGVNQEVTSIYVSNASGTKGQLIREKELLPVYKEKEFKYTDAPNLFYFNKLYDNGNYDLKEIWILKKGKNASSTNRDDWRIYEKGKVHFTNKADSAVGRDDVEVIGADTVIRLVYDTTGSSETIGATFYDYDITEDGVNTADKDKSLANRRNGGKGINNPSNYKNLNAPVLAFGNANSGTGLWNQEFIDENNVSNRLNMGNRTMAPVRVFKGCTFQIADSLKMDGTIQYDANVRVPDLFNEKSETAVIGKFQQNGYGLEFTRNGDGYTLSSVKKSGNTSVLSNLDHFVNPRTKYPHIWTNNFWPMDAVQNKDPHTNTDSQEGKYSGFGAGSASEDFKIGAWGSYGYPPSDDNIPHNNMFGMYYTVDFQLTEDYIGPLEYLFFGDDDMWVFLSKVDEKGGSITNTGTLVCDIGGVHSSVGEYVDLWDYIRKGDNGSYRLSFFYTERGLSGSTCYMEFTLPSVSLRTPNQNTGNLKVTKKAIKENNGSETDFVDGDEDKDRKYSFTIALSTTSEGLHDDYAYKIYNSDGSFDKGVVLKAGEDFSNKSTFELSDGQYIEIMYLPLGMKYQIIEEDLDEDGYKTDINGSDATGNRTIEGTIQQEGQTVQVQYKNKLQIYSLPETGGSGMALYTMAGALCIMFGTGFLYKRRFRERRG